MQYRAWTKESEMQGRQQTVEAWLNNNIKDSVFYGVLECYKR